ncbi:LuxR family transcriptional regulator [Actinoplanes sp. L3-i22]|uniref:helix-turn-helix transcriptional regulator n=1 Tax=Actinoplanes sp. L3-i22 TaxID=2836373 RepID=UPI001C792B7A|nr:LuxR family transcriptional regulator [Actinoplanes sp. L3-i22]BCY08381.1 LuxR family transcriptional regulator [Actinoplanes sp. L3-i22]
MIGRERELAALLELLSEARAGRAAAVVLRGEAGIGKSTLLAALERAAADTGFQALTCAGVQSEASIGMAGLHQLLHGAFDRVTALPPQQRDALRSAFGIGPDVSPDRLVLSVAVLSLLEDLAGDRPLLLVLEDVQWLDEPSLGMIAFVARRLRDVPVLIVATCRAEPPGPLGTLRLPEMVLDRLPDAAAAQVLGAANPALGSRARALVLDEAEGNPLALIELARGLAGRDPAEVSGVHPRLPLSARLERVFAGQVAALPGPAQDVLLIAAAITGSRLDELAAVAERLGLGLADLAPAEEAGLVRADEAELRFRHPLVRSAVYEAAARDRRVAVHEAVADVLTAGGDQPGAAWHRAAATTGADEAVAADLEQAAATLTTRGDTGAAARSWARAADLSATDADRARRFAHAAETGRMAGLNAAAARLAAAAIQTSDDPVVLARAALAEEVIGMITGVVNRDPLQVGSIARRAAAGATAERPEGAYLALALLFSTAMYCAAYGVGPDVRRRIVEDVRAVAGPVASQISIGALALLDPVAYGEAALTHLREIPATSSPTLVLSLALAAEPAHDWVLAARHIATGRERAREMRAVGDLTTGGVLLGRALAVQGRLTEALAAAEEGNRLAADLGEHFLNALGESIVANVHAWRGETEELAAALARSRALGTPIRVDMTVWQRWSQGLAELGAGRHWHAYIELTAACEIPNLGLLAIADLAEAACRAGYARPFAERLAEAREQTASFSSPLLRSLLLRAEGLLAEDDGEPCFRDALAVPGAADYPLQIARTRLVYGEWLRRQRRINEARAELAAAADAFRAAGARPWLARADAEARAAGVAVPETADLPRGAALTAQELQIARLAAEGRTNKEIADHLFLSHRTVGAHLYRVYPKLGISGRGALREAIAGLG